MRHTSMDSQAKQLPRLRTAHGPEGLCALQALALQAGGRCYLLRVVSMHLHELADIELGSTQDLDLPDKHALQWVDSAALLLNVLACT